MNNEQKDDLLPSASLVQNGMLGAVSVPEAVLFLEWVSSENYWRLSKDTGHKWFKLGKTETYTSAELYQLFLTNLIHPNYLEEYNKQLEYESSKLNTL
jgi:hypothetical protein